MNSVPVSVLMVSYNSEKFIEEAISSILVQTWRQFELVILDDNSTDGTWDIINRFDDPRIRKFRNEINLGEYRNRSKIVSYATGTYCIFIDADDLMYAHGLSFMLNYVSAYSDCAMIVSRPWDEQIIYPKRINPHQFYSYQYFRKGMCGINFTKVFFKTEVLKANIPFPQQVKLGDFYIQLKIAATHDCVIIPDASTWWRRNTGQASERLLNDYFLYLEHSIWIDMEMLNSPKCPLDESENEVALRNIYGNYLRFIFRQALKGRIIAARKLLKLYPVPARYRSSLFHRQVREFPSGLGCQLPLRD